MKTLLLFAQLLAVQAREKPDTIRAELSRSFSIVASTANETERRTQIVRARDLSRAYAIAWSDSFLVRQVTRFERSQPSQQKTHVVADSLRLAGNFALGREGVPRAMTYWREALRRAAAVIKAA